MDEAKTGKPRGGKHRSGTAEEGKAREKLVRFSGLASNGLALGRLGRLASEGGRVCTELDGIQRLGENICDHIGGRDVGSRDDSSRD